MTHSAHRHGASCGASCRSGGGTSRRGVEARELELAATRLDMESSDDLNLNIDSCQSLRDQLKTTRSRPVEEEDVSGMSNSTSAICTEDTGSFIQVVVKKHHSKKETEQNLQRETKSTHLKNNAVQTSPMVASSPINEKKINNVLANNHIPTATGDHLNVLHAGSNAAGVANPSLYVMPHPVVLVAYPPQYTYHSSKTLVDVATSARSSSSFKKIIRKEFPHRSTAIPVLPKDGNTCDEQNIDTRLPGGSKRWLHEALSKFTMKRIQPTEPNPEKIELYYFDRGSCEYYETTDCAPLTVADQLADRAEKHATRFWAEVFGVPFLAITFLTAFLLQFERFILYGVFRPLVVGVIQIFSDYLIKPSLAVLFNAVIQPPLLFLLNVLASLRDLCEPVAECVGYFLKPVENILGSLKLVQITNKTEKCAHNV